MRRVTSALTTGTTTAARAVQPTRTWVPAAAASRFSRADRAWRTVDRQTSSADTRGARALSLCARASGDDDRRGGSSGRDGAGYPDTFLDMGPRIRKTFPDELDFDLNDWDIICDVRSPSEWLEDHIPGSISTPVLDDAQRARVGTIYKQESPFLAKKVGASLVAKNLGKIMDEHFLEREKDTKVLVYCWRGGERSLSLAHVLSRVGFSVGLIPGGYKRYRAGVLEFLRTMDGFRYHLVAGKTGCAKGKMLEQLRLQGAQVLDLERMAQHRGSVLGEDPETKFEQPSQKMFDTRLWEMARHFDRSRPIFVEGESSMIGRVQIPKNTWKGMRSGTVTLLEVPMWSRVRWIRAGYEHFETTETARLLEKLQKLIPKVGHKKVQEWEAWVQDEKWDEFVEDILINHYDTAYALAAARSGRDDAAAEFLMLPDTEDATYETAAADLIRKWDVAETREAREERYRRDAETEMETTSDTEPAAAAKTT